MSWLEKILGAFRESEIDVIDDPEVVIEDDIPSIQFRNIDLSKIDTVVDNATQVQVDSVESQTIVHIEKKEQTVTAKVPNKPVAENTSKTMKTVSKPVSSTTSSNYEFIRVISPTSGLKDVDMEEPPRRVVTAKTTSAISSIGTILSPTAGNYSEKELHGEEIEQWQQMRVDDFLEMDSDTVDDSLTYPSKDNVSRVEEDQASTEVAKNEFEGYERVVVLPTMFEAVKKTSIDQKENTVEEKQNTIKEQPVKDPQKTIVNLSLFDDEFQ